jgi:transcriptional regulator with XRE-family HTH domain
MTGAEYRTLREACGMALTDCAAFHGVSLRTVQHWEEGRNNVSAEAGDVMRLMCLKIDRVRDELVAPYARGSRPAVIHRHRTIEGYQNTRYGKEDFPMRAHDAAVARAMLWFMRRGRDVSVVWAEDAQEAAA